MRCERKREEKQNARGEENERREKVGCKEEEKDVRPEQAWRRAVRNGRKKETRGGKWSGEQPSTLGIFLIWLTKTTVLVIQQIFLILNQFVKTRYIKNF